jgi:hypothetical protein
MKSPLPMHRALLFAVTACAGLLLAVMATAASPPSGSGKLPDLLSGKELVIGGAVGGGPLPSGASGHHVAWNASVELTERDAFLISNGACAFNISYELFNVGPVDATGPFKNVIRSDASTVSTQSALSQPAMSHRTISTQAYLAPGSHLLTIALDDGHNVAESVETNNYYAIRYTLGGKCGRAPLTLPPTR